MDKNKIEMLIEEEKKHFKAMQEKIKRLKRAEAEAFKEGLALLKKRKNLR